MEHFRGKSRAEVLEASTSLEHRYSLKRFILKILVFLKWHTVSIGIYRRVERSNILIFMVKHAEMSVTLSIDSAQDLRSVKSSATPV
jgi:hypothetical protein